MQNYSPTYYACWVGLSEQVHVSIFARCPALDIFTFTLTLSPRLTTSWVVGGAAETTKPLGVPSSGNAAQGGQALGHSLSWKWAREGQSPARREGQNAQENFLPPAWEGKERGAGHEGPRSARPHLASPGRGGDGRASLTAPSSAAPPSECIWRSSSASSSFAAGTGTPGWGPPGRALRPAPARPPPATFQPRHAPSPRLRTAASSDSPPL